MLVMSQQYKQFSYFPQLSQGKLKQPKQLMVMVTTFLWRLVLCTLSGLIIFKMFSSCHETDTSFKTFLMISYEWQSYNTLYLFLTTEFYIIEVGDGTMSKTGYDVYHAPIKTHTCSLVILIFEIKSPSCVDPEGVGTGGPEPL